MKDSSINYLHEIPNGLNEKDAAVMRRINTAIEMAFQSPGTVKKVAAEFYVVVIDCELVALQRFDEYNGRCKWIAREYNNKWASMLYATMSELKESLGI